VVTTAHDPVSHAELDLAMSRIETQLAELRGDLRGGMAELRTDFERTAHAQTRQMFTLLIPVYGGIVVGLLVFIASRVL
jgi:hypothetical protein